MAKQSAFYQRWVSVKDDTNKCMDSRSKAVLPIKISTEVNEKILRTVTFNFHSINPWHRWYLSHFSVFTSHWIRVTLPIYIWLYVWCTYSLPCDAEKTQYTSVLKKTKTKNPTKQNQTTPNSILVIPVFSFNIFKFWRQNNNKTQTKPKANKKQSKKPIAHIRHSSYTSTDEGAYSTLFCFIFNVCWWSAFFFPVHLLPLKNK